MIDTALVTTAPAVLARHTIARHSKSFALASRLLGKRLGDHAAVVYTWCRRADDAVDDAGEHDARAALLRLRGELDRAYAGGAVDPVTDAFGAIARTRQIPRTYPDQLLAGMEMDVDDTHYQTFDELRTYAWRVAGVVGLMMSHVFGVADDDALVAAAQLGIAMQLTNICRDVAEDWQRRRLYLPDDLLASHGASGLACELGGRLPAAARRPVAAAVAELLTIADRYYAAGERGIPALPWRAAIAVRAASRIYAAIGARIRAAGCDVLAGRAVVGSARKLVEVPAALGRIAASAPARWLRAARGRRVGIPRRVLELGDVGDA